MPNMLVSSCVDNQLVQAAVDSFDVYRSSPPLMIRHEK
jgi:hypothetical protein